MLTRFIVVIMSQYIQILNHCRTPEINTIYDNYTSIFKNENRNKMSWLTTQIYVTTVRI